jgi:ABC-2 type transport system permease protein
MLWYKAWLETRWRFLIGLVLLLMSACGVVLFYPEVLRLLPAVPQDAGGELGRRIREATELARDYRGYVWSNWFGQNLVQTWTIFAVIIGTGGLLSQMGGGGALFTLSLPVTRRQLVGVRAATGLAELLLLALIPSLLVCVLSPAIGYRYSVGDAIAHALCLFTAGTVFFSGAFLLSTFFADVWRPLLFVLGAAMLLALAEQLLGAGQWKGLFSLMNGEAFFRSGRLPWLGLLATAAGSGVMLAAAAARIERQDF